MKQLLRTLLTAICCVALPAAAETAEDMLVEMNLIQNNTALMQAAVEDGRERGQLCFRCHGDDGNSKRDYIPNLASQNALYLFTQFEHFANGSRKDYVMSKLAGHLSKDDRIAIAIYFSQNPVTPRQQPVESNPRGEKLYKSMCFACHGSDAHGSQQYPRIAGQPYEYLELTLMKFLHKDPERKNSPMSSVVQNLSEQELKDVAAYVAHMP
ncbi:c-type cytochrome [Bacterioplanoides pacificum]|uniref:C-type cytochrome n=1 Tax=Bacterioplanoides pacificum TaxID=1171596 RepID=A0ABV7VXN6_9GAMM